MIAWSLATIPYGGPVWDWYMKVTTGMGIAVFVGCLLERVLGNRDLVFWPMFAILGSWALSIWGCLFPGPAFDRSLGMFVYAPLFLAGQAVQRGVVTRRAVPWLAFACVSTIAIDLMWQVRTGYSLIREVRVQLDPRRIFEGWIFNHQAGSMTNKNDLAVMSILLPLCVATLRTWPAMVIAGMAFAIASSAWIVTASRQILLGWALSLVGVLAPRIGVNRGRRIMVVVSITVFGAIAVISLALPGIRIRILEVLQNPLADRGMPIAYGLKLFLDQPLFGVGPSLYGHHWVVGVREGWSFLGNPLPARGMPWAHCLPVEVLCELGLLGFTGIGVSLMGAASRLRRAWRAGSIGRDHVLAYGVALCCMMLVGLIDLTLIKDWVRVCFWLLLGGCFASIEPQDRSGPTGLTAAVKG
jgi:hypothetical protein